MGGKRSLDIVSRGTVPVSASTCLHFVLNSSYVYYDVQEFLGIRVNIFIRRHAFHEWISLDRVSCGIVLVSVFSKKIVFNMCNI